MTTKLKLLGFIRGLEATPAGVFRIESLNLDAIASTLAHQGIYLRFQVKSQILNKLLYSRRLKWLATAFNIQARSLCRLTRENYGDQDSEMNHNFRYHGFNPSYYGHLHSIHGT
jgi:hypothetical protein